MPIFKLSVAAEITDVGYVKDNAQAEVVTIDLDEVLAHAEEFNPYARNISLEASKCKM